MRALIILILLVMAPPGYIRAQVYVEGGNTRHRFAQLLLGADLVSFPSSGRTFQVNETGEVLPYTPGGSLIPRINIAGTHFWGHASFYVSIPIGNLLDSSVPNGGEISFNPGVETGLRIYPWRIEQEKLRPFAGTAFSVADWRQSSSTGAGAFAHKTRIPFSAGLTYQHGSLLFDLGIAVYHDNGLTYHTGLFDPVEIDLPNPYFWFGVNYQLETTLSAEKDYRNGITKERTAHLAERRALNGWSIAAGPSAAFILGPSTRNEERYPAIGDHRTPSLFFDLGLGYYFYKTDIHLNLAYRANRSQRSAYGVEQDVQRRSMALEAYKFLFDYHGFVPFIGPHLSREWHHLEERVNGDNVADTRKQQWGLGISFGWDIRPDDLQPFLLRTNLRYTPLRDISRIATSQLEFNFIQLVIYPGRGKRIRESLQ